MAEEHHNIYNEPSHDDMSVMKVLLQSVKGISLISTPPILDPALADEDA